MSVKLRGRSYHYRFTVCGKDYSGVCVNCFAQKEAEEYEKQIKFEAENIRRQKTVVALVENYKYELTGGEPILLDDAYALAAKKPSKRVPCNTAERQKQLYWTDFISYMGEYYPAVKTLSTVRKNHCEAYVSYLIDNGRFIKEVKFSRQRGKRKAREATYTRDYLLSGKTIKEIAGVCKWVFSRLLEDAGVIHNPWLNVVLPKQDPTDREIFTEDELILIRDGIMSDEFCRPLFLVAAATGLTEGDICTLRWDEVDWSSGTIYHTRRKTGVKMAIPILADLRQYLESLPKTPEYLFPDHADMYLNQPCGVSYRVKSFLDRLGIISTKTFENRRAISVKDLHSMRHVFCYYAGQAGIPLATVQAIVGHMTPEMTKHYMAHVSMRAKREAMDKLPAILKLNGGALEDTTSRRYLAELAYSLPLDRVEYLLSQCRPVLPAPAACR